MEDAKTIIARCGELESKRAPWEAGWQQAADYCLPRKSNITRLDNGNTGPGDNPANRLYDTTAIEACEILANGQSAAIAPADAQWFAWEAPDEIKSDEADQWYADASERSRKRLTRGNFYQSLNESFVDRSAFGIACFAAFTDATGRDSFQTHPIRSYAIEEDDQQRVDTVFRRWTMGIKQIVQMFGEQALAGNRHLEKAWDTFKTKGTNQSFRIIHGVFPRFDVEEGKMDALNMPIASVYVVEEGQTILRRSGFEEMPYAVIRYLRRSGADMEYGYAPFDQVQAAIWGANRTKQIARVVAQKVAVPPVLVPESVIGNVDQRPGGVTVFRSLAGGGDWPREWGQTGNPQWMFEILKDEQETIRRMYRVDIFRMFADREKVMTAREVSELSAERLMSWLPSATLWESDFEVAQQRIFSMHFRAGVFGPLDQIPDAVKVRTARGAFVPPPRVVYQSRFALAIRQAQTAAADRSMERAIQVSQVKPEVLDNIDFDEYVRESARSEGAPEGFLVDEKTRDKLRAERQQGEQAAAEQQQAMMAVDAAQKLGVQA